MNNILCDSNNKCNGKFDMKYVFINSLPEDVTL